MVQMASPQKRKKSGVYYFRRRVPADLVDTFGVEVIVSLDTKDASTAKSRFSDESVRFDDKMRQARLRQSLPFDILTVTKAQTIASLWFQDTLEADAAQRLETDGDDLIDREADVTAHEAALEQIESINGLPTRRRQAAMLALVADDIAQVEKLHALRLEAESVSHVRLAEEILAARIKVETVREARQRGTFDVAKKLASGFAEDFPDLPRGHSVARQTPSVVQAKGGVEAPPLSEVVKAYLAENKPPVGTEMETNKTVRRFIEVHGDVSASAINKAMVREWKALVEQLPKRQTARQKKMTVRELVADCASMGPERRLTFTSVNKDVSTLGTVLRVASVAWEFPDAWRSPTEGMKIRRSREQRKAKRQSFTDLDLKAIFSTPIYTQGKRVLAGAGEAAKWIPLLAIYTGARLGELGQLCVDDVVEDAGVMCIDINERDDKAVKTKGSVRLVPLHSDLTNQLGFLQFVEQRRKADDVPWLFNELRIGAKKTRTGSWGQFFGRVLREDVARGGCGIKDDAKVFHSFRHTFKTKARAANVPEFVHDGMTGHAAVTTGGGYGDRHPLVVQSEWLEKMDFSTVLNCLMSTTPSE